MPREPPVTNAVRPLKVSTDIEISDVRWVTLVYFRRIVFASSSRQGAKVVAFHLLKGPWAAPSRGLEQGLGLRRFYPVIQVALHAHRPNRSFGRERSTQVLRRHGASGSLARR